MLSDIEIGAHSPAIATQLAQREAELADLSQQIQNMPSVDKIPLPDNLAVKWSKRLDNLDTYIEQEEIEPASELLKSIVQKVVVSPKGDKNYELKIAVIDGGCGGI